MTIWRCVVDGVVITSKLTDDQVYERCDTLGSKIIIRALENWLARTDGRDRKGIYRKEFLTPRELQIFEIYP